MAYVIEKYGFYMTYKKQPQEGWLPGPVIRAEDSRPKGHRFESLLMLNRFLSIVLFCFTFEYPTFTDFFKVRQHVIGCINHDL